ncbi:hypothetical protein AB0M47_21090 [Hamadaea sp. NPDC051192]|uniref:hypothetical protein n=1 Tax=Hamadaea sp. NPDC051192 TaxID=3154940 RepID=UPI0034356A4D
MTIIVHNPSSGELANLSNAELITTALRPRALRKQYEAALAERQLALKELVARRVSGRVLAATLGMTYTRIRQIVRGGRP